MSVPVAVTVATVEEELPGIRCYAARHGWEVVWNPNEMTLRFLGEHPGDNASICLIARPDGYRALPPAWTFEPPSGGEQGHPFFPRSGSGRAGRGSVFHGTNVICAPFNRLAYKQHGGPHSNWGGPEAWLQVKGKIRETTLAGMFASILGHLRDSTGMK